MSDDNHLANGNVAAPSPEKNRSKAAAEMTKELVNAFRTTVENADPEVIAKEQLDTALVHVKDLLEGLWTNDGARVDNALQKISAQGHSHLFDEVGKLTRTLHSSLSDFRHQIQPKIDHMVQSEVPKATDQLQSVIEMTNEATHRVLGLLEQQSAVLEEERLLVEEIASKFVTGNFPGSSDEWISSMGVMSMKVLETNAKVRDLNTQILMAQEFQDLSGQMLKKVITVVTEVENSLVTLVKMFALPNAEPKAVVAEKVDQSCNQDDVNDLLASLGF